MFLCIIKLFTLDKGMKVIKHLKHETPEHKLKLFFRQMPLLTRLTIPAITVTSIVLLIIGASRDFRPYSFLDVRPVVEMLLLIVIALTDFQMEERKGSIFFILSYGIKILIIAGFNQLILLLFYLIGVKPDLLSTTSYPLLYCFAIAFRDMILKTSQQRYLLISPFRIKYVFYPIFLAVIFQLIGLRIDLLTVLIASTLMTAVKLDQLLLWVSKKLDKKLIGDKAIAAGMLATGCSDIARSQIDRVTTNHSIVLDEN